MFGLGFALAQDAPTVWFRAVPNTIVDGTTSNSAAVNANFAQIIVDGNAGAANLLGQVAALGPVGVPSGAIVMFNNGTCPLGFKEADGSNGTPDVRGIFIRGLDNGAGRDPGRVLGSYQADQFHTHTHSAGTWFSSLITQLFGTPLTNTGAVDTVTTGGSGVTSGMASGNVGTETRPPNIVLNHCAKS